MTSASPAHAPSPTSYTVLREKPARAIRYPLIRRVSDWWAGRRDGKLDLAGIAERGGPANIRGVLTPETSVWLAHNTHRERERHEHELLAHQARTVRLQIRREAVTADLDIARGEQAEARVALDAVPMLTDAELTRRGAAENTTPEAVVRARRAREHHTAVVAPVRRRLDAATGTVDRLTTERHDLDAHLTVLTEVTQTRKRRITEFHQRRADVYRRAYLRALLRPMPPARAVVRHLPTPTP